MTPGFILWETRDTERPEQALTVALDLKLTPAKLPIACCGCCRWKSRWSPNWVCVDKMQAAAGWWLLRGLSAPAICAARGSLLGVRPRWRAVFIIYRDGVNNNLFTACHRLETYYSRVWWNIQGAIWLTCLKNFAHNKNAIYLQGLFPLSVSREVLRCMMNGPSKSVMTSVVSPPTSSYLRSTAAPLGTPATAGISSQT